MPITWPVRVKRGGVSRLGDAEIGQPRPSVGVEQHVLRLDVSVQDAGRVDVAQRREQLAGELAGIGRLPGAQQLGEIAAGDQTP